MERMEVGLVDWLPCLEKKIAGGGGVAWPNEELHRFGSEFMADHL